jgi:N-acetylneuraminate synthase
MIDAAKWCGVEVIKLQKRNPKRCLSEDRYNAPYDSLHSFGKTYGEHRNFLEFTIEQHADLQKYAEDKGLLYTSSVWDSDSFDGIAHLEPPWIKIPSAHNEDWPLLTYIAAHWRRELHISNGMVEDPTVEVKWKSLLGNRLVPYTCASSYPASNSDVCLLDLIRLKDQLQVSQVGFSGHHKGIALDIAAVVLGAKVVERHFTLDRTAKGTDQAASLEPAGLARLVRDIKAVVALAFHEVKLQVESGRMRILAWKPKA